MQSKRFLTGLTLGLALTFASASAQEVQLSGRTGNLSWTLYGPGQLQNLASAPADTLRVSAPPGSRVVGTKYGNGTAILAFRADTGTSLNDVLQYHDQQLNQQGFRRVSQNTSGNEATATYQRGGGQLSVRITRDNGNLYRAYLDLTNLQAQAGNTANNATASNANTTGTANQATGAGNMGNPVLRTRGMGGVVFEIYPAVSLGTLNNSGTARFSAPQGATWTDLDVNGNGDINGHITGTALNLQQVMDFYDRQFKQQGYTLVNPTDTGAGGDGALTYIYERGNSRVSFSVEAEGNTYRVVWDFQDEGGNTFGNNVVGNSTLPLGTYGTPLYGYTYGGLGYDFYGPNVYGPNYNYNVNNLRPNAGRVSLAVPQGATNIQRPAGDTQNVRLAFDSQQSLREVFNSYDRQLTQQGFQQTSGQVNNNQNQITGRYRRSGTAGVNNDVLLTVQATGNNRYAVTMNFNP